MSLLKWAPFYWFIGAIIMPSLAGCSDNGMKKVSIDGHEFEVPRRYILEEDISWIPGNKGDGFAFVANPEASKYAQNIITVGSAKATCHPATAPDSDMLFSACDGKVGSSRLEKVFPHDGITFEWEYRAKAGDGSFITVASCSSVRGGQDGLCTSLSGYNGLVYSVKFMDSKISTLPSLMVKARDLLETWKVS